MGPPLKTCAAPSSPARLSPRPRNPPRKPATPRSSTNRFPSRASKSLVCRNASMSPSKPKTRKLPSTSASAPSVCFPPWTKPKSCNRFCIFRPRRMNILGSRSSLRNANVLILTDDSEFARLLTACWQTERQAPGITVLGSESWKQHEALPHDLVVVGPLNEGKLSGVLRSVEPAAAVILCVPADSRELGQLRTRYPRLVHVALREDWAQTLLLVAGESLRRAEAVRASRQAERHAARN